MKITIRTNTSKEIQLYKRAGVLTPSLSETAIIHIAAPLPGTLEDVEEVKDALETHGFNVTLKTDLNKAEFERALAEFVLKFGKDKDNRLLF